MLHLSFNEFEAYTDALGDVDVRLMLLRQERKRWELDSLMAGRLHVQKGQTGSPLIAEAAADADGQLFWVPVAGRHHINGEPNDGRMVLVVPGGADFTITVHGEHEWLAVFVPRDLCVATNERHCSACSRIERSKREQVVRFRNLLAAVVESARLEPSVLTAQASVASIQAELLAACASIVGHHQPHVESGRPLISRAEVVQSTKKLMDLCDDQSLHIGDLARAVDVSPRTLQTVFVDYYGMPPLRYFTLRRLHDVRAALRKSDPEETTVTGIAARFGFWQFGRFAAQYGRLFGELPSTTLAARRKRVRASAAVGWPEFAPL